jgi:PAS domain S-box-containing protein
MPWGAHFCHFFESPREVLDTSVPFLRAGLENQEFCLWLVDTQANHAAALNALRQSIPGLDQSIAEGRLEIRVCPEPSRDPLESLNHILNDALARGCTGLRIVLNPNPAHIFSFERELKKALAHRRIVALCHFPLTAGSAGLNGYRAEVSGNPRADVTRESWRNNKSYSRTAGTLCGLLAIILGFAVLAGWVLHFTALIQLAPGLPAIPAGSAVCFVFIGIALLGMARDRQPMVWAGSAGAALLAVAFGVTNWGANTRQLSPAAAFCFFALAVGLAVVQVSPPARKPFLLGMTGLLAAIIGVSCGISVIWGGGDAFGMGNISRMAVQIAAGFVILGTGSIAVALGRIELGARQPIWVPIAATLYLLSIRIGLVETFSPRNHTGFALALMWLGAFFGAVIFGVFVHLALNAHLQRKLLESANMRLEEEMLERDRAEESAYAANEQLEQRVEERTRALAAANGELHLEIARRERVEEDLRRQKEILQTIFDHIPVMINFGDEKYNIELVNREWERTLGWTVEELRRENIDIVVENYPDPEYREQVKKFVRNSHGEWADFKTKVRDGRVIDTTWCMLHLSDGTNMGFGQDISLRKRAEEALRDSEERFRQLAENIQDLFWIKTPDFKRVLYLSPTYQSMTGRSPDRRYQDENYHPFLEMIVPEDRDKMRYLMQSAPAQEFDVEFRIQRPDGSVRWIRDRGFPIRDESGRIYRIAGIANDITDRKLADDALRDSEERFRQLTENIREVFWLRSPDFKQLLYVSPIYQRVCGKTPEAIYSAGVDMEIVHPEDRQRVIEVMRNAAGREFEIEYRIVLNDGVRWLRDRGFPIRNQDGQVYRIGGVAEDITDRKEAEDRLRASSEQLRALSASLQSAREKEAARIAHQVHDELGGTLTGLRWELESLEKMIQQPPEEGRLQTMRDKLASMLGLTDSTIDVVRRIASDLRPSILDDLGLMDAIEWQTEQFQTRTGIQCRCDCILQTIPLREDQSTAVFRIFQEALTNILRHAQATRVCVAMKEDAGLFILTVTDNGRGITPAEKLSRKSLGLLGMQERAQLTGGQVEIAGAKGTGTTLSVRMPLAEGSADA